jgi:hypothetical protein
LRKFKYRQYKQTLIKQLDSLHDNNPKLYWNLIKISESSAAAPSTEISVPSIVFELKFLSLLCISVEHNANRNFSDDSSDQISKILFKQMQGI